MAPTTRSAPQQIRAERLSAASARAPASAVRVLKLQAKVKQTQKNTTTYHRHASNYLGLVARYVTLVVANAWRTRGPLRILSLLCVVGAAWTASAAARPEHGDDCPLAQ